MHKCVPFEFNLYDAIQECLLNCGTLFIMGQWRSTFNNSSSISVVKSKRSIKPGRPVWRKFRVFSICTFCRFLLSTTFMFLRMSLLRKNPTFKPFFGKFYVKSIINNKHNHKQILNSIESGNLKKENRKNKNVSVLDDKTGSALHTCITLSRLS